MKKMTKAMLMTALICGTMYCGAEPVHANELDTFTLDEYVVTATRTPVKVFDANANISVVTREEIENAHYDNLEDAIRNMPGVTVLNYGNKGMNSNSIRINGSNNVILLIDGVRANYSGTSIQASYLDLDNVESIEVLKGAASALYGADAKGGVINVITRTPNKNKTTLTLASGSFGAEQYKLRNEGKQGTWSYSIDVGKEIQGDYEDGDGNTWENKYNSENVNLKVKKDFSEGSDLTIGYDYNKFDWKYQNPGNNAYDPIDNPYGYRDIETGDTEQEAFYGTWNQKIDDTLSNTLTFRNTDYIYNCYTSYYTQHYKTLAISDYITKKFGNTHTVTLGADYVRSEDEEASYYSSNKTTSKALYLQDEWNFDKKWKLTSGIRFDDHNLAGNATTPRINLGYKFNEDTNMYVSYSEFFISPSLYEYFNGIHGNPDLDPEEGENYEIGFNHKFDETFTMSTHLFKRKTDNKLIWDNGYKNADEDAKGFDIQFSKLVNNNLSLFTGYTYTKFNDEATGDNYKGYIPRHAINFGLDYNNSKFNAVLNARASLERGKSDKAIDNMFPDKNYVIVDLAANYQPEKNVKLFAKVNNLFDKYYAEHTLAYGNIHGDYYAMPGRTILVGMEYSF